MNKRTMIPSPSATNTKRLKGDDAVMSHPRPISTIKTPVPQTSKTIPLNPITKNKDHYHMIMTKKYGYDDPFQKDANGNVIHYDNNAVFKYLMEHDVGCNTPGCCDKMGELRFIATCHMRELVKLRKENTILRNNKPTKAA